jgi:hypothetical protein
MGAFIKAIARGQTGGFGCVSSLGGNVIEICESETNP